MTAYITEQTPGLLPLDREADYSGKMLVVSIDRLGVRYKKAAYQIVHVMGGSGCKPDSLGSKCFGVHVADRDDAVFRRNDFIGEASPELIEQAMQDKAPMPIIPENMLHIAFGNNGAWGRAATVDDAKKQMRKAGATKCLLIYRCHETAYVTDMGGLSWPKEAPAAELVYENPSVKN